MQQLELALGALKDLQETNVDFVVSSFAVSHSAFLRAEDFNGFFWCIELLQGTIRKHNFCGIQEPALYDSLLKCFADGSSEEVEDSRALAAFHVARIASEDDQSEAAKGWFQLCLGDAKSSYLKYMAAACLGRLQLKQKDGKQDALAWFTLAIQYAETLKDSSRMASYLAARAMVALGRSEEGLATVRQQDGSRFAAALLAMLEADIETRRDAFSLEDKAAAAAHSRARAMLVPLMSNLEAQLTKYVGSSCCSYEDLLEYVQLDHFSKRYLLKCSRSAENEQEGSAQIERSFFIFRSYRESRMEMIRIQASMDPRPHLEHGIELLYSEDSSSALEPLVICQQLSLKAGHWSGFFWASGYLDIYCSKQHLSKEEMVSRLASCFRHRQQDAEDSEAWALYYAGRPGASDDAKADVHLLQVSFKRSRTAVLRYHAALTLGDATDDFETRLCYYELMKKHAEETGNEDLIINACVYLFGHVRHHESVQNAPKYGKADTIRMMLSKRSLEFSDPRLAQAILKYMDGLLCFDCKSIKACLKDCIRILETLPMFPSVELYHPYLAADHRDSWSVYKNFSAQTTYSNAHVMLKVVDHIQGRPAQQQLLNSSLLPDLQTSELLNSLLRIDTLFRERQLQEAEEEAANMMLQLLEQETSMQRTLAGLVRVYVAGIATAYHQRGGCRLEDTVVIVNEFMEAATNLAEGYPVLASFHASLLHMLGLGQDSVRLELFSSTARQGCIEVEDNFGGFSTGRINNLEYMVHHFRAVQFSLWDAGNLKRALVWAERERARDLMYRRDGYYSRELAEFDTNDAKAWEEIQEVCNLMGEETVFLVITREAEKNLLLYFLHSGRVFGYHQLIKYQIGFFPELPDADSEDSDFFLGVHYDLLIRPFTDQLEQIQPRNFIFVPSGDLCGFPFGALLDTSRMEYLIQRYAVSMVSSLRLLKQCELRRRQQIQEQKGSTFTSLVVGNPTLDLDGAREEAESVARILKQQRGSVEVIELSPEEATKERVLGLLPKSDWVHIATHGIVTPEGFPDGALLLASSGLPIQRANRVVEFEQELAVVFRETGFSGVMTGDEIMELKEPLRAAAVVLSACNSGVGRTFAEGVLALPRAFHVCSVPSVVVTLWEVPDGSTRLVMDKFYENLHRGLEIAQALQQAVVSILEEEDEFENRVYGLKEWAPFLVSGTPCTTLQI